MSMTVTNNAPDGLVIWEPVFQRMAITAAGALTYLAGTLMARKTVVDAVTVVDGTNTGDGTVTLATVAAGSVVPVVGAYNLEVTEAVANGGVFKLVDPNGAIVGTGLAMTVGAGAATIVEVAGLVFTVTDGATDFVVGDSFALTVAADGGVVAYSRTGAGGAQIPIALILDALVFAGAGDKPCRPIISGRVRRADLVVHGVGAITDAEADMLRDYGIIPLSSTQLAELDNQ